MLSQGKTFSLVNRIHRGGLVRVDFVVSGDNVQIEGYTLRNGKESINQIVIKTISEARIVWKNLIGLPNGGWVRSFN